MSDTHVILVIMGIVIVAFCMFYSYNSILDKENKRALKFQYVAYRKLDTLLNEKLWKGHKMKLIYSAKKVDSEKGFNCEFQQVCVSKLRNYITYTVEIRGFDKRSIHFTHLRELSEVEAKGILCSDKDAYSSFFGQPKIA